MFSQLNLTSAGALLASQTALGDQIEFTCIKMGDGNEPVDYKILSDLVHPMQSMPIAREKIVDINTIALGSNLFPDDIKTDFYWREVGLFAKNITKGTDEVLFSYGYTSTPSYISAGSTLVEKYIDIDLQINNAENVVINLDYSNLFPTKYEMNQHLDELDQKIQNDIRSSKNIWLVDTLGELPGSSVDKSEAMLANLNTESTGEQATPNIGDTVITDDGHVGYISKIESGMITITTTSNGVERKKQFANGDWEMYLSQEQGGGHYFWDSVSGTLSFEGLGSDDNPRIVYERYCIDGGSANFDIIGGSRIGARLIYAWSGENPGEGELKVYYTTNKSNNNYTTDDEVATEGWVKSYVSDNTGIYVGTARTHADLLAGNIVGTPQGHNISLNDWAIVEQDETHQGYQTSYIVQGINPVTWSYATTRDVTIPSVDNETIYLNSDGKYAVKPGAPVQLGNGTATDNAIGTRTITSPIASSEIITNGTLTEMLQGLANNVKYLMDNTVKAPNQKIHMYVQDTPVTPEAGINKVRIPISENQ